VYVLHNYRSLITCITGHIYECVLICYRHIVTMETVCNGDFLKHDLIGGKEKCWVKDILVHTDPDQDEPVVIIADVQNNELRTFDVSSWQCVSRCTTPSQPVCLYESDGGAYVHCMNMALYQISSVRPLASRRHHTDMSPGWSIMTSYRTHNWAPDVSWQFIIVMITLQRST
jgi:hypothetical protein